MNFPALLTRVTNLFSRRPIASKPYKLTIDQENYDGTTDADGKVERDIPMDAQQGKLEVEGYHYDVRVSHMDPIDTVMGEGQALFLDLAYRPNLRPILWLYVAGKGPQAMDVQ